MQELLKISSGGGNLFVYLSIGFSQGNNISTFHSCAFPEDTRTSHLLQANTSTSSCSAMTGFAIGVAQI